jgi:hypothetical protein
VLPAARETGIIHRYLKPGNVRELLFGDLDQRVLYPTNDRGGEDQAMVLELIFAEQLAPK